MNFLRRIGMNFLRRIGQNSFLNGRYWSLSSSRLLFFSVFFFFLLLFSFVSFRCIKDAKACDGKPGLDPGNNCLPHANGQGEGGGPAFPASDCLLEGSGYQDDPLQIRSYTDLLCIGPDASQLPLNAAYVLLNDIDASSSCGAGGCEKASGEGGPVIGTSRDPFVGIFSGQVEGEEDIRTISNLYINRPGGSRVGLFGSVEGAHIKNLNIESVQVIGQSSVGALVGYQSGGLLENLRVTGARVSAVADSENRNVGGDVAGALAGSLGANSIVENSEVNAANVTAETAVAGGLVGLAKDRSEISRSRASGAVSAPVDAGGLVGKTQGESLIRGSHANVVVSGETNVGGLVGHHSSGTSSGTSLSKITENYAQGEVRGSVSNVGGLVGKHVGGGIVKSYATGTVRGTDADRYAPSAVGALVGYGSSPISYSYASGSVYGNSDVGGLIGHLDGADLLVSYADGAELKGRGANIGGLAGHVSGAVIIRQSYSALGKLAMEGRSGRNMGGLLGYLEEGGAISHSFAASKLSSVQGEYVGMLIGRCGLSSAQTALQTVYFLRSVYPFGRSVSDVGSSRAGDCYLEGGILPSTSIKALYENFLLSGLQEHLSDLSGGLGWAARDWGRLGAANVYPCINGLAVRGELCEGEQSPDLPVPARITGLALDGGDPGNEDGNFRLRWTASEDPTVIYKVEVCDRGADCRSDENWRGVAEVDSDEGVYDIIGQDYGGYIYRVRSCYRINGEMSCYEGQGLGGGALQPSNLLEVSVTILRAPENLRLSNKADDFDRIYDLEWDSVSGAARYEWQEKIGTGGAWGSPQRASRSMRHSFANASQKLGPATYYYQMRACPSSGPCGDWSLGNPLEVNVALRDLSEIPAAEGLSECQPAGLATGRILLASGGVADCYDGAYDLRWNSLSAYLANEVKYELEEKKDGEAWVSLGGQQSLLSFAVSGKSAGIYSYRVRACTSLGCAEWPSLFSSVEVPPVPAVNVFNSDEQQNVSYDGEYTLNWSPVNNATRYLITEESVENTANGPGEDWVSSGAPVRVTALSHPFSQRALGKSYRYRIQACVSSNCSRASNALVLRVEKLGQPATLQSTAQFSYEHDYTLYWDAVSAADKYILEELRLDEPLTGPLHWGESGVQSHDVLSGVRYLPPAVNSGIVGFYYYRVKACKERSPGNFVCGDWTELTDPVEELTAPVELCAVGQACPASSGPVADIVWNVEGAVSHEDVYHVYMRQYVLSWTSIGGAKAYHLQRKKSGGTWEDIEDSPGLKKEISGLSESFIAQEAGEYSYRLEGCGTSSCSAWQSIEPRLVVYDIALLSGEHGLRLNDPDGAANAYQWNADGEYIRFTGDYSLVWDAVSYPGVNTYYKIEARSGGDEWNELGSFYPPSDAINYSYDVAQIAAGIYGYRVRVCVSRSNSFGITEIDFCSQNDPASIRVRVQDENDLPVPGNLSANSAQIISYEASAGRKIFYTGANKDAGTAIPVGQYRLSWDTAAGARSYKLYEQKYGGVSEISYSRDTFVDFANKELGSYQYRVLPCLDVNGVRCSSTGSAAIIELEVRSLEEPGLSVSLGTFEYSLSLNTSVSSDDGQRFYYELQEEVGESGQWNTHTPEWDGASRLTIADSELGVNYAYRVRLCLKPPMGSSGQPSSHFCSSWSDDAPVRIEFTSPELRTSISPILDWYRNPIEVSWFRREVNNTVLGYCLEEKRCSENCIDENNWVLTGARSGSPPAGACDALWIGGVNSSSYEAVNRLGYAQYKYRIKKCNLSGYCSPWSGYGRSIELPLPAPASLTIIAEDHTNLVPLPEPASLTIAEGHPEVKLGRNYYSYDGDYEMSWDTAPLRNYTAFSDGQSTGLYYQIEESVSLEEVHNVISSPMRLNGRTTTHSEYSYQVRACTAVGCGPYAPSSRITSCVGSVWGPSSSVLCPTEHFIQTNDCSGETRHMEGTRTSVEGSSASVEAVCVAECSAPATGTYFHSGYGTASNPYLVCNYTHLDNMRENLSEHYVLGQDIDASASWSRGTARCVAYDGSTVPANTPCTGWAPIGYSGRDNVHNMRFTGSLDGAGYVIDRLYVNLSGDSDTANLSGGLFGGIGPDARIKNVGLTAVSITVSSSPSTRSVAGGLVGHAYGGAISNSYVSGSVTSSSSYSSYAGGLVGDNLHATISNSYATGSVSAFAYKTQLPSGNWVVGGSTGGGLVGMNFGAIRNSYATASVSSTSTANSRYYRSTGGGLVGNNNNGGTISNSYATGSVGCASGQTCRFTTFGGLAGSTNGGTISGRNYFVDSSGGSDGVTGGSTCGARICQKKTLAQIQALTSVNGWATGSSGSWNFGTSSELPRLQYAQVAAHCYGSVLHTTRRACEADDSLADGIWLAEGDECDGSTGVTCGDVISGQ